MCLSFVSVSQIYEAFDFFPRVGVQYDCTEKGCMTLPIDYTFSELLGSKPCLITCIFVLIPSFLAFFQLAVHEPHGIP